MSSNMLAGERRWASARRGGMTVLGKVAVPKPLNLPSQRLENHGLDPSVEIVPKGTLSWGSRGSSSGSNAWTSSPSPNADGGSISPSHHGGRPSSAGSGTRPSTAGSEKTHEPSAWGSNSRPSSASGILTSSQSSSTVLRPRSAENRPNSSQLSRFAEPISENPVAWGPSSTAERLGIRSSKEDVFSLTSGDFPTLGTEKDNSLKNLESQGHGRPISASGRMTQSVEEDANQADTKRAMVNTWRMDGPRVAEDGVRPSMENWQGEPPQFFNPNVAPQHFDAWRGPPVNPPSSVWYRGPPRGPAFGGPGGFPMEPFTYYRPIPPQGSQPVPPPGAGPRGPHLPTGELYRPHMHDSYARSGVPYRPSFYSGPPGPMNFDGYYGPHMGYCNNERDMPFMGMAGAPVYSGYAGQSARDSANSPARPGGLGITGKQMEADSLEDVSGSKSVPRQNHGEWDRKEEGVNWEHNDQHSASHPGKSPHPMIASRKNEWGADNDGEEDMFPKRKLPGDGLSRSFQYRDHTSQSVKVKLFESTGSAKGDDAGWTTKAESVATYHSETPQLPLAGEGDALLRPASKDSALMQKIEGLNAKVRASDRQSDTPNAHNWEEQRNRPQIVDLEVHNNIRRVHGGQGRVDHHGKVGKFEGESVAEESESIDLQSQRAKMRELAKQRALELQREEEERSKEQKAKALAKLEELNRRTQAGEAANLIAERTEATSKIRVEEAESHTVGDPVTVHPSLEVPCTNLVSEPGIANVEKESSNSETGGSVEEVTTSSPQDVPQKCVSEPNSQDYLTSLKQDGTANARNLPSQLNGGTRIHKQTGYKEKRESLSQKSANEKSAVSFQKNHSAISAVDTKSTRVKVPVEEIKPAGESDMQNRSNTVAAPSTHHRKKVDKSTKNKNKLDETATAPLLPGTINPEREYSENRELSNWDIPVSTVIEPDGWQIHEEPLVESPSRVVANQWKPQPPRRMPRGQLANRYVDKVHSNEVIWAPVRTQHKTPDDSVDASKKSTAEAISAKSENVTHNNFKGKRAEMERYVPKPVAKELAQQGSFPPSSSSVSDESPIPAISSDVVVSSMEIKEGGDSSRVNKHKKDHGQWRLRGKTDTRPSPIIPEPNKEIQQCREDEKDSDDTTGAAVSSISDTGKDQGAAGRGRRHLHRGHRDHQTELNHTDVAWKESQSLGASHWKPKSHSNHQHENTETLTTEINKHQKVQLPMETTNNFPTQLVFGSIVADIKPAPTKAPKKDEVLSLESAPIDIQNDSNSGRNGQNNRFTRRHDNRQNKVPALHERQRQNVQYEYHPVGPAKGGNPEKVDGGVQNFKVSGQSQPKRGGNYYRRQPGGVRIDPGQN